MAHAERVTFALAEATNIPVTPPVGKIKSRAVTPAAHSATPAKGIVGTPLPKAAPKRTPGTPASTSTENSQTPHKTPGRTRPNRAKSVPPRPKFEAELGTWDRERLIKELIDREVLVANLEEDVVVWAEKWSSLKEDGQELYKEFINHSMRNKRFAEVIVNQKKEVEELKTAKEQAEKQIEQLKIALQQAEVKKNEPEEYCASFQFSQSLSNLSSRSSPPLQQQSALVRSARETALLNQNVALQTKCSTLELEYAKLMEKSTQQEEVISKLEAQVSDLKAKVESVDQDNESKAQLAGSPVRKLEALSIRSEALRARNNELEQKFATESLARLTAERELRQAKIEMKEKEENYEKSIAVLKEEAKAAEAAHREALAQLEAKEREERAKLEAKIARLDATVRDQAQQIADSTAARSDVSLEAQLANERAQALQAEKEQLVEEVQKQKANCSALEADIRLLYAKHRNELKELDAKYARQDYKARYHRVLNEKKLVEKKLQMAMETLESIPTMSASSHILAGLLNAGVDAVQNQQRVLLQRREAIQEQEAELEKREQLLRQLKEQVESEKNKALSLETKAAEASDERQQLLAALKAHKMTVAELREEIVQFQESERNLKLELEAAMLSKSALGQAQEELYQEEISTLKQRQAQQSQHIQSLRAQVAALEEALRERESLLEENEFVQAENQSRLIEENDRLIRLLEVVQRERDDLRTMVDAQGAELQNLQEMVSSTISKLEEVLQEREALIAAQANSHIHLQNSLSAWKGSQRALKAEREHRAANKRLLQKELAEIQQQHAKQLAEMQQHLHMREEEAQRLLDELQDVQSVSANQITSLQRMLDAATSTGNSTELAATKEKLRDVEQQLVLSRSQFEKQINKLQEELSTSQLRLQEEKQARSDESTSLLAKIAAAEAKSAELEQSYAALASKLESEWKARINEKVAELKEFETSWAQEKKALEEKIREAATAALPNTSTASPQVTALMREYAKTMTMLTQQTDARVAQERAMINTLQLQVQNLSDNLDAANRACREAKADLARTHLIEQQLMLQLELLLNVHQKLAQQLSAKQAPEQTQQLVQQLTSLRSETARLQREALVWRQKCEEATQHRDELLRDRDAIKSQLIETQMDYQEKIAKLTDEPWKAIARQQKQLWLKFQQAQAAQEDAMATGPAAEETL